MPIETGLDTADEADDQGDKLMAGNMHKFGGTQLVEMKGLMEDDCR